MDPRSTDDALQSLLDEGAVRARRAGPDQGVLWAALTEATRGGKRFRPALVLAAHDALGGTHPAATARVGAAVELLHTAFVVHDDVIDGDDRRRGRLNVSGTFREHALRSGHTPAEADELARTAGILAGDLALTAAVRAVATTPASPDVVHRLLDLVDDALHTTASGELADVRLSLGAPSASVPESLLMEEQKTGAYSFSLPLQAGAVLAGADATTVAGLGEAGRLLGVAFQLVDDLLGVFGDPERTGKSATGDLRTRKQTPLLAHARSTPQWPELEPYLGRELTGAELDQVRLLLTVSGSRAFVEALADSHVTAARDVVEELGLPLDLLPGVPAWSTLLADGVVVAA